MIVEVWQRTQDLAKTGTSGQDTEDEWNSKANSAQKILQEMLTDAAEINQKATDALSWLKKSTQSTSAADGKVTLPDDYLHFDTLELIDADGPWPAHKLTGKEISNTRRSPIRKSDLANHELNYYFKGEKGLYTMPEQAGIIVEVTYYKMVPDAAIVLTPAEDAQTDYVVPTVGTDFGWPASVFNLLVYTILEQLGIELSEPMLYEYAQFGINRDTIKTAAQ